MKLCCRYNSTPQQTYMKLFYSKLIKHQKHFEGGTWKIWILYFLGIIPNIKADN